MLIGACADVVPNLYYMVVFTGGWGCVWGRHRSTPRTRCASSDDFAWPSGDRLPMQKGVQLSRILPSAAPSVPPTAPRTISRNSISRSTARFFSSTACTARCSTSPRGSTAGSGSCSRRTSRCGQYHHRPFFGFCFFGLALLMWLLASPPPCAGAPRGPRFCRWADGCLQPNGVPDTRIQAFRLAAPISGCNLTLIALNGAYLDAPRELLAPLVLPAGARADIAVRCFRPGAYSPTTLTHDAHRWASHPRIDGRAIPAGVSRETPL